MSYSYSQVSVQGRPALRVRCCVPLCEIGNDAYNNGLYLQATVAGTATVANLNPYEIASWVQNGATITAGSANWISPHMPLMAIAFDRYVAQSLTFHYEPQSTATLEDRLVFAWTDDPSHPFLSTYGSLDVASATPSQLQLLVTQDSIAFMPWKSWSLTVPVAKDPRFMYAEVVSGVENTTLSRFSDFGAFSCVGSAAPTVPILYGILYAEMAIDLFDPVPIVAAVNLLVDTLHATRKNHKAKKLVKKPVIPLPPSSTPLTGLSVSSRTDPISIPRPESKTEKILDADSSDDDLNIVPSSSVPSTPASVSSKRLPSSNRKLDLESTSSTRRL
jgi:hypothetical protein